MLQQDNSLLTLKDLAERLGCAYGRLRGFVEAPAVAGWLGAEAVAGVKGVRYPPEAEEKLARLLAAADQGLVTPKTAEAWLVQYLGEPSTSLVPGRQQPLALPAPPTLVPAPVVESVAASLGRIAALMDAFQSSALPHDDKLLTPKGVQELVPMSLSWIARNVPAVKCGRRRLYRRSEVLEFIAKL